MADRSQNTQAHEDARGVWVPLWMIHEAPSLRAALLLAQLAWLFQPGLRGGERGRFTDRSGERWLALSDHELAEQIGASEDAVYRARLELRRSGFLLCTTAKVDGIKRSLVRLAGRARAEPYPAESRDSHAAGSRDSQSRGIAGCTSVLSADDEQEEQQPGASGAALELAAEELAPGYGFEQFWSVWPERHGKKIGRGDALKKWARLDLEERRAAFRGALNYAAASDAGLAGAQDAFRWLEKRRWEDWQQPAQADGSRRAAPLPLSSDAAEVVVRQYGEANGRPHPQGPPTDVGRALPFDSTAGGG